MNLEKEMRTKKFSRTKSTVGLNTFNKHNIQKMVLASDKK